jgi:hypothetical protein
MASCTLFRYPQIDTHQNNQPNEKHPLGLLIELRPGNRGLNGNIARRKFGLDGKLRLREIVLSFKVGIGKIYHTLELPISKGNSFLKLAKSKIDLLLGPHP